MRTITVFTTSTNAIIKIETSVTTWGELKPILEEQGITTSRFDAITRQGLQLSLDSAQLEPTDFTIYLAPPNKESGALSNEDILHELYTIKADFNDMLFVLISTIENEEEEDKEEDEKLTQEQQRLRDQFKNLK